MNVCERVCEWRRAVWAGAGLVSIEGLSVRENKELGRCGCSLWVWLLAVGC